MSELASLEGALVGGNADEFSDVIGRKPAVSAATARTVSKMVSIRQGGQPTIRGPAASFRSGAVLVEAHTGQLAGQVRATQHAHGTHTPSTPPCTIHARVMLYCTRRG